jgi:hypothetical protein
MRTSTQLYCLGLSALVATACRQPRKRERSSVSRPLLGDETRIHTRPTTTQPHAVPSRVRANSIPVKRAEVLLSFAP